MAKLIMRKREGSTTRKGRRNGRGREREGKNGEMKRATSNNDTRGWDRVRGVRERCRLLYPTRYDDRLLAAIEMAL